MIETKFSSRLWLGLIPIPIMFVCWIMCLFLGKTTEERLAPGIVLLVYAAGNALFLLPYRKYWVDEASQTLIVKTYFPSRETVIPFSRFDSVVSEKELRMRGGPVRVLRFKKDGKVLLRMSGDIYKNLDEVERHLTALLVIRKN